MRLRTSIESDLRSRIEDELRDLSDRRSNVDRVLRAEDIAAYRAAVAKASTASRRSTLTDEHWLAPLAEATSFAPPSEARASSAPPCSFISPPSFDATLRGAYPPPPASSSSSVWTVVTDADSRDASFARQRAWKGLLAAALVISAVTVGLFGGAAARVEIPTARASGGSGATTAACSELATLENPVVVTAPAPTLKPASHHRSRPASSPPDAKPEQTPTEETTSVAPASASPATPAAPEPALEDAARTARMLREQLDGARH